MIAPSPLRIVDIPDRTEIVFQFEGRRLRLTNLRKPFWPELGITKRDLLQYYADVAPLLIPHLIDRAMVMKRYPNGAHGDYFYMKRIPIPHPDWIETCPIDHGSDGVIDFPMVQNLPALLWIINLGCIDLNPWYARFDAVDQPDFLHFDLDPGPGAGFDTVCAVALHLRDLLGTLGMSCWAKTTGSRGIHVYIPIVRGPSQKAVWTFSKIIALQIERLHPKIATTEYRKANRPHGTVNVDYNQNAWGRTLSSIYSVRPTARASLSAPVSWDEIERGISLDDFRIDNALFRFAELGDLWLPLLGEERVDLAAFVERLSD